MASNPVPVKHSDSVRTSMPDLWKAFRTDMDRLFDRFGNGFGTPSLPHLFETDPNLSLAVPAIDVAETDKAYIVTAELPGLDEKDIDVSMTGDLLVIKGEKRQEREEKTKNYYIAERSYGKFHRSFTLPSGIESDRIAAAFSKGILTITLPKSVEAQKQQKKIDVKHA